MAFLDLAKQRYSCRSYQPTSVEQEKLEYVMECVRMAPSAVNKQPWRFRIVSDADGLKKICQCYNREWIATAPTVIIASIVHDEEWVRSDGKHHGDIDIAIAVEHLCLAATEQALATCWVCNFDATLCHQLFSLGANEEAAVLIPIGYPADEPKEKTRKPMKEILFCMCALISLLACGQGKVASVAPADSVDSVASVDTFDNPDGYTTVITPLMHASLRIQSGGFEIEVDPVAKLGDRTVDYSNMPEADLILVTHEHFDHFDTATIKRLSTESTITVMNPCCHELSGLGQPLSNGMTLNIAEDVTLEAVPAYNVTKGREHFHPQGRDNGYILSINGLRIYIAGDTEPIPEMEQIRDIDIAFLPCNQPYTMTVEQLVEAAKIIKPKVLYPYHFGQTDLSALPDLLKDTGIDVRIRPFD